jgi:hypothetical protein
VQAINSVGTSLSSPALAILAAQAPSAPISVTKQSATKTAITIQWTAPKSDGSSALTGYNIFWDNGTGTIIATSIGSTIWSTLTFTQSGLTTNQNYLFAV